MTVVWLQLTENFSIDSNICGVNLCVGVFVGMLKLEWYVKSFGLNERFQSSFEIRINCSWNTHTHIGMSREWN